MNWTGEFHLKSYGDLCKIRDFTQSFGYILWKWEAPWTMCWWVSSERFIVTWVRFGTFTQSFGYILWKVRSNMNHGLVSFIWESYGAWVRLGAFTQSLSYILWKVRSTMCFELLLRKLSSLSKVRYFHTIFWLHSVEGEKHHEIWAGEFHLRKLWWPE